jgi:hypothetical protein
MADRMRGTHQRGQTATRPQSLSVGDNGMKRWVGLGVISDNLINIGRVKARKTAKAKQY